MSILSVSTPELVVAPMAWLNAVDDLSGHLGRMACAVALAVRNTSNLILSKAIIYHGLPGVGS